ncbi:MAG: class I SAM-dependent methyltransferase [Desulfovibrionales bacterium]
MSRTDGKAPNRVLSLRELADPFFKGVLSRLDALLEEKKVFYLHPSKRWEYPWALERAGLQAGQTVLDAGCGASIFPTYLAEQGCKTWAMDLDFPEEAVRAAPELEYVRGDLTSLPFSQSGFDAVFCISVIEHLPVPGMKQALSELRRVLKPEGILLLTTDLYRDAAEEVWYEGSEERFKVDWNFFDQTLLNEHILKAPGFRVKGEMDLAVDWERVSPEMIEFHGYPYTSVGVALEKDEFEVRR